MISDKLLQELQDRGMEVPKSSEGVIIKVHAPSTSLPTISLTCELLGSKFDMQMAVFDDIVYDVILGGYCPILYKLMSAAIADIPQEILTIQTRQTVLEDDSKPPLEPDANSIALRDDQKADLTLTDLWTAAE